MGARKVITVCRYYPGNDYILATGTVIDVKAGRYVLLIDRTEVIFERPLWQEVIA